MENGDGTATMSGENKKTTETGYINKNNQRNAGKTDMQGTDHGQYLYAMECLNCGHKYFANGSDIYMVEKMSGMSGRRKIDINSSC